MHCSTRNISQVTAVLDKIKNRIAIGSARCERQYSVTYATVGTSLPVAGCRSDVGDVSPVEVSSSHTHDTCVS